MKNLAFWVAAATLVACAGDPVDNTGDIPPGPPPETSG